MAHGKKIGPVDTQQANSVQTNFEACLDLRHTAVGCMERSNTDILHQFQNKLLRNIVDAPWYIRNANFHWDLQMGMVTREIRKFAKKHEERLHHHVNVEAIQLFDNTELVRRLNKGEKKKNLLSCCSDP